MRKFAFTLTELLSVLAIMIVLAAVLFPVFRSVKMAGERTVCVSNLRQAYAATMMYCSEYDDHFMPVNHIPGSQAEDALSDRTWVQLLLPYVNAFSIFKCPSDSTQRVRSEAIFDQDLIPGDSYERYYAASMRTNIGYNYLNLAPVYREGNEWISMTKPGTSVLNPSNTLLFVDSVWSRDDRGNPSGGGSWLVVPPCRYEVVNSRMVDTVAPSQSSPVGVSAPVFAPSNGWKSAESTYVYGGAWPWHTGRINVIRLDGSIKSVLPPQLKSGCNFRTEWAGVINDLFQYPWDTR